MKSDDRKECRTDNNTYPKGEVLCSKHSFMVNETLVFQIKFCDKSAAHSAKSPDFAATLKFIINTPHQTTYNLQQYPSF